jgi:diguanylate cyclase (GGDEF)-like protein/PAS domain S-box-containing protein
MSSDEPAAPDIPAAGCDVMSLSQVDCLVKMKGDFREALAKQALQLVYQPQVDVATRQVVAFEALLRWRHPVHGEVKPSDFIAWAEDLGLLGELSAWVLRRACTDALTWPDSIGVAVNISAVSLVDTALSKTVAEVLRTSGLPPRRLELEVTESALVPASKVEQAVLHRIRDGGVRIAIDDFDIGYSCLGYLLEFPFDKIKIDQSFVRRLGMLEARSDVARAIVASVSRLCVDLGIVCLAEGVETAEQFSLIAELGCAEAQGYLLGRPMPETDVASFLASRVQGPLVRPVGLGAPHISFLQIAETANDIIIVTTAELDPPGPTIVYVNPAFTRLTGYAACEVIGANPRLLQGPGTSRAALDRIGHALRSGTLIHEKVLNYAKGGAPYWLDLRIVPLRDHAGRITHFAAIQRDVTLDKRQLDELEHLADRDTLTGISNRRAFVRAVETEIKRAHATQGGNNGSSGLFVAVIDVDKFKVINDLHGHAVGDAVLCGLAERLLENARRVDVVSRVGGDEFALCMPGIVLRDAEEIVKRLRRIMRDAPVSTPAGPLLASVSIGIARHMAGETLTELFGRADAAMYASKRAGRNGVRTDQTFARPFGRT